MFRILALKCELGAALTSGGSQTLPHDVFLTVNCSFLMQLAGYWPNGFMDNHAIKRAICRAKDRRRALHARRKVKKVLFISLFSLLYLVHYSFCLVALNM